MKGKFTLLTLLAATFSIMATAQADGDYRSNIVTPGVAGIWSDPSIWEIYDAGTLSWIPAVTAPSSANGVVSIRATDSVIVNSNVTIDQVVVDGGASPGVLVFFNASTPFVATLANGTSDEIAVNGRMWIATNATVSGAGTTILLNATSTLVLTFNGTFSGPTVTNNGLIRVQGAFNFTNSSLINNEFIFWTSGLLTLNTSTITNNDSISVANTAAVQMFFSGASSLVNATTGVIIKQATGFDALIQVPFTNQGRIRGNGNLYFNGTVPVNTGTILPGSSPGILTVAPQLVHNLPTTIDIEIASTGAIAGTNYDQLRFNSAAPGTVSLSNATLNVTINESDPIGTVYTILDYPAPVGSTITGTFATTNIPFTHIITYNANSVTLTKTATLPLIWGRFDAIAQDDKVLLKWTTLQEVNTSKFVVEYSKNGRDFTEVAALAAAGNSGSPVDYNYVFNTPDTRSINFFRIKQLDIDGKSTLSQSRYVKFDNGRVLAIQAYPNPVRDRLQLNVQAKDLKVYLYNLSGKLLVTRTVQPGQQEIDMSSLPAGVYQLMIYQREEKIEVQKIVKL